MSSRQLRKLQKQRELQQEAAREERIGDNEEAEESEDEPVPITRPKINLFAALNDDDDADAEDDNDEDEEQPNPEPIVSEPNPEGSAKKNKKKKKKKNKKKAAGAGADGDDVLAARDDNNNNSDEDEIDKAIKELKISSTATGDRGSAAQDEDRQRRAAASNTLLQINPYHLKAIHEMRNLFGREVIESANAEEEQQQQQQQTRRGGRRRQVQQQQLDLETFLRAQAPNAKKLPEVSLRRNIFIQGRDYWPAQSAGGLTMKDMGKSEDGTATEYAYVHDGEYDSLQMLFFGCVQIGDPMRMVHLLKKVPYHVSTLLQVSFVAKQDQNMALSSELCERALFTFGRVTTSAFRQHVEQGRARLNFRRPENRQFWLAGYHYLRSLLRKGTFRTALEWAKLLYAMDPQDPYAMRYYLHFLAVRAYESKWLLDFLRDVEENATHQEQQQHEDFVYVKQSGILARLQMGDVDTAKKELEQGIRRVPWLYCALFQELGLDAPPSIWGVHAESDARRFWVALYIHFAKDLWNNTQATALLTEVAKGMEKKVSVAELPTDDDAPDLGATRLAYLEGQTNLIALAPRTLLERQPNYEFDPLPPAEEDNVFTKQGTRLPWLERKHAAGGAGATEEEDPQAREALARMRNILAAQGGAGGAGAGAGRPVRGFGIAGGGGGDMDGESEYDDETDEELRRDLEEHARRSNEPGFLGHLMQMLGMRGAGAAEAQEEEEGEEGEEEWERYEDFEEGGSRVGEAREGEEDEDVPGAWPGQQGGR